MERITQAAQQPSSEHARLLYLMPGASLMRRKEKETPNPVCAKLIPSLGQALVERTLGLGDVKNVSGQEGILLTNPTPTQNCRL